MEYLDSPDKFKEKVSSKKSLVIYCNNWCLPCKDLIEDLNKPTIIKFFETYNIDIFYIQSDCPNLDKMTSNPIISIPSIEFYQKGVNLDIQEGYFGIEKLLEAIVLRFGLENNPDN